MSNYLIQGATLDNIANAVNNITGESGALSPAQMASKLSAIEEWAGDIVAPVATFTLTGRPDIPPEKECDFEVGMNWTQWCDSSYNDPMTLFIMDNAVREPMQGKVLLDYNFNNVSPSDTIVANQTYVLMMM